MKLRGVVPLNWIQWVSLVTTMAVAVLLPVLVIQGREQRAQANQGLRTFICFFESAALHPNDQPPPTGEHRAFIRHFFSKTLKAIHQPPCGP